jgi:DnaJ-class molecular chaperone
MKIYSVCPECLGTGQLSVGEGAGPCGRCNASGKLDFGTIDIESLQTSIDQVAEVVKESSDYIRKIYEIVSKGK